MCRYKNAGVVGYAKAFLPVQSDLQTSEWCSYFENDVLVILIQLYSLISAFIIPARILFILPARILLNLHKAEILNPASNRW